ncbi:MAG: hypothetical protein WCF84_01370 [Anaerolineae bacterium]
MLLVLSGLLLLAALGSSMIAYAQGPAPTPVSGPSPAPGQQGNPLDSASKIFAVGQLVLDILQGKPPTSADALFQQSQQDARALLNNGSADLFFLDFGNPNIRLNEFAGTLASNLLALTPLYLLGYLGILIYDIWKERPIPNPILYTILVVGVMIFLAAFGVITQGLSELGVAIASAIGGAGDAMFARATFLDTILRVLAALQANGGVLSVLALLVAMVEALVILIQLAYRGLSMAIWRLLGVLLIPISVLLEGVQPKTAGKVISGFFEAWLDMVGKVTLLLIVLAVASSEVFKSMVWLVLPAGLLIVVLSWKFLGVLFAMVRDAAGRAWNGMIPDVAVEPATSLPAGAEAARSREIDEERKRLLDE